MTVPSELGWIGRPEQAAALMHPLRATLLRAAAEPASATELAARLGLPRQRVNYHVRALARAGLLRRAGRRRKRNMIEQRYVATAKRYVLSPDVIGPAAAHGREAAGAPTAEDAFSAAHLLVLTARTQSELGRALEAAKVAGKRLSTFSLDTELRFENAAQRAEFAEELQAAVLDVVARHAGPAVLPDGRQGRGRPYRLMVGCHPVPEEIGDA